MSIFRKPQPIKARRVHTMEESLDVIMDSISKLKGDPTADWLPLFETLEAEFAQNPDIYSNNTVISALINYSSCLNHRNKTHFLDKLSFKGIGNKNSQWISFHAKTYEEINNIASAIAILNRGITFYQVKDDLISKEFENLKVRIKALLENVDNMPLGEYNSQTYKYQKGILVATCFNKPVEPELDLLKIIGFENKIDSANKQDDKPSTFTPARQARFYTDYELYAPRESQPFDPPSVTAVSSFPAAHFGAYAASFTESVYGDMSYESPSFVYRSGSYGDFGALSPSFEATETPAPQEAVDTPQVSLFWARYGEYPQVLRKQKKRSRRRNKKSG